MSECRGSTCQAEGRIIAGHAVCPECSQLVKVEDPPATTRFHWTRGQYAVHEAGNKPGPDA